MDKNKLREAAIAFCEKNITNWKDLDEFGKMWYIKKVSVMLLEDPEVKMEIFKAQIN